MTGNEAGKQERENIAVVGLGYVGLPLAVALSAHHDVTGFDVSKSRVAELKRGHDRTDEIAPDRLEAAALRFTSDAADLAAAEIFIVAVPTPVDGDNQPDLGALEAASEIVGGAIRPGAVVVYESTVYPGVTEDICGAILARKSGLHCGSDFFLGYSPERINPGDREHTVERITKVVAGQTPAVAARLKKVYGAVNNGNIFVAADIRTAEAAKVIENAQRDINIAFVNEIAAIFDRLGISTRDVLAAAGTKWNFLDFKPGLVGGHCIGVDPYYLAHVAEAAGMKPEIILAGRRINDGMSGLIARRVAALRPPPGRLLVLGITFKENVPDIRNSKVADLVRHLKSEGFDVAVHDPLADAAETKREYGIKLIDEPQGPYDAVVAAVAHDAYRKLDVAALLRPGGLFSDIKGAWSRDDFPETVTYWAL
jgi:UDP-N-acetyl-D-galactosamine dehydrogenase